MLYERHVLHSLAIARFFNFPAQSNILDIGTGGGFPGIPLAIFFPEVQFLLVDSIAKKINVVNEIVKALSLNNVKAIQARAENIDNKFHFVVNRAVADFSQIVGWVENKIEKKSVCNCPNGIISLKGGNLAEELKNFPKAKVYELNSIFTDDFFETKKIVYLPFS
jgi:16S rRNA (guanine527-N7)-methyltransferase